MGELKLVMYTSAKVLATVYQSLSSTFSTCYLVGFESAGDEERVRFHDCMAYGFRGKNYVGTRCTIRKMYRGS